MSWDYTRYRARCTTCGHIGVCLQGSDDWGRSSTKWEGFESCPPDPTEVARKKTDARNMRARCKCGSTEILVEERLTDPS